MAKSGFGERQKRRYLFSVSIMVIVIALAGGFFAIWQSNRSSSRKAAASQTVTTVDSSYKEVSIQRVSDVIENSDHALVYFRSPT